MGPDSVSAVDAAAILGVKTSTVYAYISRGLLSRRQLPGDRRSWLSRTEVEDFGRRKDPAAPAVTAARARATEIAEIVDDRLRYRGRNASDLALTEPFEKVAQLLWGDAAGPERPWDLGGDAVGAIHRLQEGMPGSSLPLDRLKVTAMLLGALDDFRYDLSPASVVSVARTLPPAFVESLPLLGAATERPGAGDGAPSIAERLWPRLVTVPGTPHDIRLISAALVLLADHGLGPSTRAVCEAAATAADPYSAMLAGMSMASGLLHGGGSSLAVQAWLSEIDSPASVSQVIGDRLRRGDPLSGFGQPRYYGADPRAELLMELLPRSSASGHARARLEIVQAVVDLVRDRRHLHPNAEFALGAICFVHDMPQGAGEAIFVIARSVGWIAHAAEEYGRSAREPHRRD